MTNDSSDAAKKAWHWIKLFLEHDLQDFTCNGKPVDWGDPQGNTEREATRYIQKAIDEILLDYRQKIDELASHSPVALTIWKSLARKYGNRTLRDEIGDLG